MNYRCACGAMHTATPALDVEIQTFGRNRRIQGPTDAWWVPRIYLAVHGKPEFDEIEPLALEHGWSPARTRRLAWSR